MDSGSAKAGKWCHSWCYRGLKASHGHECFVRKDVIHAVMDEYVRQVIHANFELDDVCIIIYFIKLQFHVHGKRSWQVVFSGLTVRLGFSDFCLDRQIRIVLMFLVQNLVAYLLIETRFSGQFLRQPSKCGSSVYVLFLWAGLTDVRVLCITFTFSCF